MRFLVLGPLGVVSDHGPVRVGPVEQQALLVALVLNANRPVAGYRLIDGLWPRRSGSAMTDLRVAVNGLHEALGAVDRAMAARLVQAGGGFLLRLGPQEADCVHFAQLLGQGQAALAAQDHYAAAHLFTEAMSLWRGPPAAGLPVYGWLRQQVDALQELRTDTTARVVQAFGAIEAAGDEFASPTGSAGAAVSVGAGGARAPRRVDPSRARAGSGRPRSAWTQGRVPSRAGG